MASIPGLVSEKNVFKKRQVKIFQFQKTFYWKNSKGKILKNFSVQGTFDWALDGPNTSCSSRAPPFWKKTHVKNFDVQNTSQYISRKKFETMHLVFNKFYLFRDWQGALKDRNTSSSAEKYHLSKKTQTNRFRILKCNAPYIARKLRNGTSLILCRFLILGVIEGREPVYNPKT